MVDSYEPSGKARSQPPADAPERLRVLEDRMLVLGEALRETAATVAHLAQRHAPVVGEVKDGESGEDLGTWVRWLVRYYELDIPECWAEHGAFVEELSALHIGWQSTVGQGAVGMEAMQWHDLAGRAFERFRGIYRTCMDGTHRPWQAPNWAAPSS